MRLNVLTSMREKFKYCLHGGGGGRVNWKEAGEGTVHLD
jgi:hypothetical protein